MTRIGGDSDRYGNAPAQVLVEVMHNSVRDLVRRKFAENGGRWRDFVFESSNDAITLEDFAEIEQRILQTGHRFTASAMISARERPDIYKPLEGFSGDIADFSFEHPEAIVAPVDTDGREQRGIGDNVVRRPDNAVGTARYVRTSDAVLRYMTEGVPDDMIAIIDDSGGTLTAPILEKFNGVICAGGTVRSHLGILTREYGIPCLMNAKISGIREGDWVEIETSAIARTAESYQSSKEMTARVWKIER